jgi:hypothetical protein
MPLVWSLKLIVGIFPQLPVSAELDACVPLPVVGEPDELDEHAVAVASNATLPRPSASLTIPRLIRVSL